MKIPNFHDGHFDGLRLGLSKEVHLFLRTVEDKPYTLVLQGVRAVTLSGVKGGNIILDLVFRSANEMTLSDAAELYGVDADSDQAANLLKSLTGKDRQIWSLIQATAPRDCFYFKLSRLIRPQATLIPSLARLTVSCRVPRPLRFSSLQRARMVIHMAGPDNDPLSKFKNSQIQVPKSLANDPIATCPKSSSPSRPQAFDSTQRKLTIFLARK